MKTKKLSKRVVTLPDGRYLVYYGWDKSKNEVQGTKYKVKSKRK